jgi:hypothetical protein
VGRRSWNTTGLSPFLSERARSRAPEILSYAAVTGAAMLVSPNGEVVLFTGAAAELDIERIARRARGFGGSENVVSFSDATTCIHAGPVCRGWMLCVLSTMGAAPAQVIERLRRASSVLALALVDGGGARSRGGGSGSGGLPAEVFARQPSPRKN